MLRLIDEKGEQLGVMETRKAISIARERELEVVVVSEKADPPVAKIVDLNKYVYKEQQRKKALAKNARATRTELKDCLLYTSPSQRHSTLSSIESFAGKK